MFADTFQWNPVSILLFRSAGWDEVVLLLFRLLSSKANNGEMFTSKYESCSLHMLMLSLNWMRLYEKLEKQSRFAKRFSMKRHAEWMKEGKSFFYKLEMNAFDLRNELLTRCAKATWCLSALISHPTTRNYWRGTGSWEEKLIAQSNEKLHNIFSLPYNFYFLNKNHDANKRWWSGDDPIHLAFDAKWIPVVIRKCL